LKRMFEVADLSRWFSSAYFLIKSISTNNPQELSPAFYSNSFTREGWVQLTF